MSWYDWPAIAFLATFIIVLQPRRRVSHCLFATFCATACGAAVAILTLIVWGITR